MKAKVPVCGVSGQWAFDWSHQHHLSGWVADYKMMTKNSKLIRSRMGCDHALEQILYCQMSRDRRAYRMVQRLHLLGER